MISCVIEVTKIVNKLPRKYEQLPTNPTHRIEYFLNETLANRPAKLIAMEYTPMIIVIASVSPPLLNMKSLNKNPTDPKLPQADAYDQN